jgi:chemotaxis response regulator CheB
MSTSVLIADDHAVVRRGLRALFENEPDITVVGEACDGLEALELVLHLLPDVAASPDAYDALTAREREVLPPTPASRGARRWRARSGSAATTSRRR